ncbi:stage II sporulation protein M [Phaeocystidibacter luteus]|uniref:Stage II sporulation protein M n=1 Tax=Phaeocystidibacter luteus TaxID=911197 RepID=A0A6N6RLD2_9FLAO|nr:stage II sporulation protein M [Phaeocystidibacter luteus]KAB2814379.1 stage II sporulation protein M [Phaeocystidibacter luteus]
MKESQFVKENSARWAPLEKSVEALKKSRRKKGLNSSLGEDYIQLTDDLGHAQTFYRRRSIRLYLNNLTSDIYRLIHKNRESKKNPISQFWLREIPSIMYHGRKQFLLAFAIFAIAIVIGAFSLEQDSAFANEILSEGYVQMTEENIANDDPMAVYKKADSFDMFTRIALNNLWVLIFCFVMGLFFGIGSIGALMTNGIMVGVFQYYFIQKGLFIPSFLTIFQHGTVELSSIILGGGAGLLLGSGYLFPGNYSRLLSLRLQFYRGMKVILALVPFIIFAAWVEAYVTRHDDIPNIYRLLFILTNLFIMVGYFVYLPWRYGRKLQRVEDRPTDQGIIASKPIDENDIMNVGEIFQVSIHYFSKWLSKFIWIPTLLAAGTIAYSYLTEELWENVILETSNAYIIITASIIEAVIYGVENTIEIFFLSSGNPILSSIFFVTSVSIVQTMVLSWKYKGTKKWHQSALLCLANAIVLLAISSLLSVHGAWIVVVLSVGYPLLTLTMARAYIGNLGYLQALGKALGSFLENFGKVFGWVMISGLSLVLAIILIQSALASVLLYFLNSFTAWNQGESLISLGVLAFLAFLTVLLVLASAQFGGALLTETLDEQITAKKLRENIASIPPRKKRYGIDEAV